MNSQHYTAHFKIMSTDADAYYHCRTSSLFAFLQQAITTQAYGVGLSRETVLSRYGCNWMVLRIYLRLTRPLMWGEELTVALTVRKPEGTRGYRDFDLFVDQEPVGEGTSAWVLKNQETGALLDMAVIPELPKADCDTCKDLRPSRIVFPPMTLHDTRKLYYSDTDINGHINNTKYVNLACDAVELERRAAGLFVQEILVAYVDECHAGDTLHLFRGKVGNTFYVHGAGAGDSPRFDCSLTLGETALRK